MNYSEKEYPLQKESYQIIGVCMEVHRILGKGLLEIVYKDAIEYEFKKKKIQYEREKKYEVEYKEIRPNVWEKIYGSEKDLRPTDKKTQGETQQK